MPFTFAPDFVIKRKRKRSCSSVNPCLGFYPDTPSSLVNQDSRSTDAVRYIDVPDVPLTALEGPSRRSLHTTTRFPSASAADVPGLSSIVAPSTGSNNVNHRRQRNPACETEALPVDEFLRQVRSSTKRYTINRAVKRRKLNRPLPDSRASSESSSDLPDTDYTPSSPVDGHEKRTVERPNDDDETLGRIKRKKTCPAKRPRTLATRLLIAGVTTGVDVVAGPLLPRHPEAHTCTRKPLPLVSRECLPSSQASAKDTRRFVDPRKDPLIHRLSVQFTPVREDQGLIAHRGKDPQPISAWKPDACKVPYVRQRPRLAMPVLAQCLVTIPLVFTTAGPTGTTAQASRQGFDSEFTTNFCHSVDTASRIKCLSPEAAPVETQILPIPLDSSRTEIPAASCSSLSPTRPAPPSGINLQPASAVLAADSSDSAGGVLTSPSSPSERSVLLAGAILRQTAPGTKDGSSLPVSVACRPSMSFDSFVVPHQLRASSTNNPEIARPTSTMDSGRSRTSIPSESVAEKPLKSLVLLMNDFREIARSATAKFQASDPSLGVRPRPRATKSPRTNGIRTPPSSLVTRNLDFESCTPPMSPNPPSTLRNLHAPAARSGLSFRMAPPSTGYEERPLTPHALAEMAGQDRPFAALPPRVSDSQSNTRSGSVDIQARRLNVLHVPSSPLPEWTVLPPVSSVQI